MFYNMLYDLYGTMIFQSTCIQITWISFDYITLIVFANLGISMRFLMICFA